MAAFSAPITDPWSDGRDGRTRVEGGKPPTQRGVPKNEGPSDRRGRRKIELGSPLQPTAAEWGSYLGV
jgi:hypothetical protein